MSTARRERCIKLRLLTLVVVTAHCINELTTPKTGITHSLVAPSAIITTYVFIGVFLITSFWHKYPSVFLQMYGFAVCICVQIAHSIIVFRGLMKHKAMETPVDAALFLNAVLPCLATMLMILDLVLTLLSLRSVIPAAVVPTQETATS